MWLKCTHTTNVTSNFSFVPNKWISSGAGNTHVERKKTIKENLQQHKIRNTKEFMCSWFCSFHKSLGVGTRGRWAFRWLVALWVTLCAALSEPSQAEQGVQLTPLHILQHQQQLLRCHRRQNKLQLSFSVCPSRFLSLSLARYNTHLHQSILNACVCN